MTKASRDTQGRGKREGKEKERKREGERGKGEEGVPSYDTSVQGHTKGGEGRVPSYDESIQGHPRKREKRGKREGKKERGRERERREKKVFPATNNRPGTHQRKRGEILSIPFRKTPEGKERKGKGRGEGGLSSRQVPMNLEQTSVAATAYGLPRGCHL